MNEDADALIEGQDVLKVIRHQKRAFMYSHNLEPTDVFLDSGCLTRLMRYCDIMTRAFITPQTLSYTRIEGLNVHQTNRPGVLVVKA